LFPLRNSESHISSSKYATYFRLWITLMLEKIEQISYNSCVVDSL
jgi:hypothetical protein